ncbi:translocation/assembly module TamB domain-containing protein [Mangrovimonas sp. YM274]|uniref:translocation/assembly module TamB domain-containing protein n=1 Tax=Mangrovimonas sp. YM274 TaxID=3070660 RepID=UPI0027DD9A60|nr:translocation/assembly module TamB domain-containing protein [Mangrovimonas sp. YM274]WMI70365.1 translocation/assembly module TamB domain-containing protein [Mangrovimonas sp. YM274]
MLILSIPAVQTSLGKYATKYLNEEFGTHISIEKVGLQFNGDVELKQIYIEDYKKDTLISVRELNTSILNFKNVYEGQLVFGDIDIMNLVFNIKTYRGEKQTNLDVFVARFDEENPDKVKSNFLMSSSDVSIYNSVFKLIDENKETPKILEFNNLNINATNFLIDGSNVSTRINTLNFRDSRGVKIQNMITDFQYTVDYMNFDNLQIKTTNSKIQGTLRFDYLREDLQYFTDKVAITAKFENSEVQLDELNTFYDEFGENQLAKFNVEVSGTLNDLNTNNLRLTTSRRSKIYGDINFKNLFNNEVGTFSMDGKFSNLSSNYYDLTGLLPNVLGNSIPTVFSKLGDFTITGDSYITPTTIDAKLEMDTELGHVSSDLNMEHLNDVDNAKYVGNVVFDEFDLGKLIEKEEVGTTSFNLDVDGKGFLVKNLKTQIQGKVFSLVFNNYDYQNIDVAGRLESDVFNGIINSSDPNFKFRFDGLADLSKDIKTLDFSADVAYANLKALNFVKKDSVSIFKGNVVMSMKGSSVDDAKGSLRFKNTTYINQSNEFYFEDFDIKSKFEENMRVIRINSPDIIEGTIRGDFKFKDLGKLVKNSFGSLYSKYEPNEVKGHQYINFKFNIYNKIVEAFFHEVELAENTFIKGRIENSENGFKLSFSSPQIKVFDYFAQNVNLSVDNSNPVYNTFIELDSLHTKHYDVSRFSLINVTQNDTLFIKSNFRGGTYNRDTYDLSMFYTIDDHDKSVVGFQKSKATFKDFNWFINEEKDTLNKIVFDRKFKEFNFKNLVLSNLDEQIEFSGVLRDSTYKDLNLNFNEVELMKITPRLDSLFLEGVVNGKLHLLQDGGVYTPNSSITIDNFKANHHNLGNLKAEIQGNRSLTNYSVDLILKSDRLRSLEAHGEVDVSEANSYIDVNIDFDRFILDPLAPLGAGIITNIRGMVSGEAQVLGSLKKPDIRGDLYLDNAGITIPYLNVDYSFDFDSRVTLEQQKFIFQDVVLTDSKYFSRALLNGYISHVNFDDWVLGLELETDRLLVLDTDDSEEALYYGTGFVEGEASIKGPADELVIAFDGSTEKGTVFKVPLNDLETYGDNSYIHFLTPEEKEARLKGEDYVAPEVKGLELDFDLIVTPDADIEIVIDRNSGSTIQGSGNGNLLFEINTTGKFNMWGDFAVTKGIYNFAYGGLIQKELEVEPGGSIIWEGDPMKAQINLTAVYKTQANPSVLLDNPINRSIPVNVEISLQGQLEQPEPEFSFNFPNVGSTIKSELEYRLETKESREFQALNLLSFGAFASEISLGQQAYGTIADRVNSLFNSLFEDEDGKLQIGVNLQPGEVTPDYETDDRLGLTLSTQLSDKVLINGKVGVPIGGVEQTVIAGDVEIQVLLNDEGTLSAKFFNRENSIRNFGEEIGYTQGMGLSYNVEFDTFKELLQIIFSGKNKKKASEKKDENKVKKIDNNFPDFINVKEKTTNK